MLAVSASGTSDLLRLKEKHGDYNTLIVGIRQTGGTGHLQRALGREGRQVWQHADGLLAVTKPRTNPLARFFLGERGYQGRMGEDDALLLSPAG